MELKLGQVPLFRCSEAVLDGFDAENAASHKLHLSFTVLGWFVSGCLIKMGCRCAQYQAPLPLMAFARTVTKPSYRFFTDFTAMSSADDGAEEMSIWVELALAIEEKEKEKWKLGFRDFGVYLKESEIFGMWLLLLFSLF